MNAEQRYHIGQAFGRLCDRLTWKEEELRRCETSAGKGHDVRKMNRLRAEIASLERRIERAGRLLEAT